MPSVFSEVCACRLPSSKYNVVPTIRVVRRTEMHAYRLYTVVPKLVEFIEQLTNIYVRYNRKRLKGRTDDADCLTALATLYNTLLMLCKVRCHPTGSYWSC